VSDFGIDDLIDIIRSRQAGGGRPSYTRKLLDGGPALCAKKLGEEATEVVIAATAGHKDELRHEAADLIYHLLVLLEAGNVRFEDVLDELAQRTSRSGLEEKAARNKD